MSVDDNSPHPPRSAWAALRVPLIVLAVTLAAGSGIVDHSAHSLLQAQARLEQLKAAQMLARQQSLKSGEEKNTIARYLGDYRRLRQEGFIGTERRIDWLDALTAANRHARLLGTEYSIDAQQPYPGELHESVRMQLRQSSMKLRLALLHEGDLARFLDHLASQHAGLFSVNDCDLQRISRPDQGADTAAPGDQPNLQAECRLVWYTLSEPHTAQRKAVP